MWVLRLTILAAIVIYLQAWLFGRRGLKHIAFERAFVPPRAFVGDTGVMVEKIVNNKFLPVPWVRAESKIDNIISFVGTTWESVRHEAYHVNLFSLMPYTKITRSHSFTCVRRGYYPGSTVALSSGDMLSWKSGSMTVETGADMMVYPRLLDPTEMPQLNDNFMGDMVVRRLILDDPFMIRGLRPYVAGDPLNRVDWKTTARTGAMMVREFDFTSELRVTICLNMDAAEALRSMEDQVLVKEYGISLCATIAHMALAHGYETGFSSNAYVMTGQKQAEKEPAYVPYVAGEGQFQSILETLACLSLESVMSFGRFLEAEIQRGAFGMGYCIVTSVMRSDIEERVAQLRAIGNAVEVLLISPADAQDVRAEGAPGETEAAV